MRNSGSKNWRAWRLAPTERATDAPAGPCLPQARQTLAEQPGPDGIRWDLVHRIRAEIAAGTYDTDDKMAAAEERLLANVWS